MNLVEHHLWELFASGRNYPIRLSHALWNHRNTVSTELVEIYIAAA